MLFSILLSFVGLIFGVLTLLIVKDIIWYLRAQKYAKQGIALRYVPLIGYALKLDNPNLENGMDDFHDLFKKKDNPKETEKLIVASGFTSDCYVFINDKDLLRDYYKIETKVSHHENFYGMPIDHSMTFQTDTQKTQNHRSIFAELFYPKTLREQTSEFNTIINRHFNKLRNQISASSPDGQGFVKIDLNHCVTEIFNDVVGYALFGGDIPEIEGISLAVQIQYCVQDMFKVATGLPHVISRGLTSKLGLSPLWNNRSSLINRIKKIIKEMIHKRDTDPNYVLGCNALDLVIAKNRSLKAAGKESQMLNGDEIADNLCAVIFGGMDTSRNTTLSAIYYLSQDAKIQKELRESVQEKILVDSDAGDDFDSYEKSNYMINFIKEALRVYSPVPISFTRRVKKNFTIGGYKISKGDILTLTIGQLLTRPEYFDDPRKFDMTKYNDEKKIKELNKSTLIPFSSGKRSCIGKNMANLTIRIILSNLLNQFKMENANEAMNRRSVTLTRGPEHCWVKIQNMQ